MSVPKYKRTPNQLECYDKAQKLYISVLRDMTSAVDAALKGSISSYSKFVLHKCVEGIQESLRSLVCNILHANAINAQFLWEVDERRKFQDFAIGDCMSLQCQLFTIAALFEDTLHCLLHYATDIEELERMIRSWRKYNHNIRKRICDKGKHLKNCDPGNFCNVDSDGNSDNNDADDSNGVRPD